MKYRIQKKQENSRMCFVCGLKNDLGLKAEFYELESGELAAVFTPLDEHQSYPGRLHGGVAGAVLDETIGRAILIPEPDVWGVTVELSLKYVKPVPLNEELKVIGRITKNTSRIFEGTGELYLKSGEVAVSASGRYLKMPIHKIANFDENAEEWQIVRREQEPEELEI